MNRWDIFCRVVDNYGDAAVCWRLARQLACEHAMSVRLWIDRPDVLASLQPDDAAVEVLAWNSHAPPGDPADVAIDAFDGGLPESYAASMGARSLWIRLEYLSAESWVAGHHGLPSPHPTLPVRRYFFFPGFGEGSGGLLREKNLFRRRDACDRSAFWQALDSGASRPGSVRVSLFGYENSALPELLQAWSAGAQQVLAAVADCPLRTPVREFIGPSLQRGNLRVRYLPFLSQTRYDELLWCCDWNFVRGEDSFVRAQWAARPFVWQAYPQAQNAHHAKVAAFLNLYAGGVGELWRAWNGMGGSIAEGWRMLQDSPGEHVKHARDWAEKLSAHEDLASNLVRFCRNLLK